MLSDLQSFDFNSEEAVAHSGAARALEDVNKKEYMEDLVVDTGFETIPESAEHEGGEGAGGAHESASNQSSEDDFEKPF